MTPVPSSHRLTELLADRALFGLTEAEEAELRALAGELGQNLDDPSFDAAAAALAAAFAAADAEPMPDAVRARLARQAAQFGANNASAPGVSAGDQGPLPFRRMPAMAWLGWAMAAGLAVVAAVGWFGGRPGPKPVQPTPGITLAQEREQLIAEGVAPLSWGEWSDETVEAEIKGVRGDVVWSDDGLEGFMRFQGLPANDASREQYQLWIIDAELGMSQRINGGVFNSSGEQELIVPILPGLGFERAVAFAVTIERPGGVWVSDMSRRVVIAARQ